MPNTTLIPATVEAEQKAFGIAQWPAQPAASISAAASSTSCAIPGHQPAHVAYYDRQTGILHTGDHLYPGRLYVTDFPAYEASTRRLVEFTATRPVAHIVGCHIEQSATPFVDYPVRHHLPAARTLARAGPRRTAGTARRPGGDARKAGTRLLPRFHHLAP